MNVGIKVRLTALGLAAGAMGLLIVLVTLNSQRQAEEAKARLGRIDSESFQMAGRFKDKLREVNDHMRRYASFHEPAVWDEFLSASIQIKHWLVEQAPLLTTRREQEILQKMNVAYQAYLQRAQDLHSLMEASGKSSVALADYNNFFEQARQLRDLGEEMGAAHFESRNDLVAHANRTLTQLRLSVLGLVALLFLFALTLAAMVYRDLIAPLQVRLVESQALAERREKLAALGMLAAGVAHEIRNPLTALKTALFMQQKKIPRGSPAARDGELIEGEILRLERIVSQFLLFARPAKPELTTVPADLPLKEVEALLAPQLAKADIRLVREAAAPMQLAVDPAQLKQVLINLVQNAADSIGRHGVVTLRARPEHRSSAHGEAEMVVLEVVDTGKGILPEVEKRLFDPFFTTKENGTGLGLSIAARIVEMHGGTLQYQTRVSQGSTFGIVLPRVPQPGRPAGPNEAQPVAPAKSQNVFCYE